MASNLALRSVSSEEGSVLAFLALLGVAPLLPELILLLLLLLLPVVVVVVVGVLGFVAVRFRDVGVDCAVAEMEK